MRFLRDTVINGGDASGNLTSAAIDANQLLSISVQSVSTGTAAGTLKLQFSNDAPSNISAPTNWTDIPSATVSVTAASTVGIAKTELCYRFVRVVYTFTSGTGTITANIMALSL